MKTISSKRKVEDNKLPSLQKRFDKLPHDMKITAEALLLRYKGRSGFDKRHILNEVLDVVTRAVKCKANCCAGKSRNQRLAEVLDDRILRSA